MKLKSFLVTFSAFIITTGLLFLAGHTLTIPWLMFRHEYTNNADGIFVTTGSLIPAIAGVIVSYLAERIYMYKHRRTLG